MNKNILVKKITLEALRTRIKSTWDIIKDLTKQAKILEDLADMCLEDEDNGQEG
jgi:hypothetical protein